MTFQVNGVAGEEPVEAGPARKRRPSPSPALPTAVELLEDRLRPRHDPCDVGIFAFGAFRSICALRGALDPPLLLELALLEAGLFLLTLHDGWSAFGSDRSLLCAMGVLRGAPP